jgi:sugar fermentation stimulation protein A
MRYDNIKRGIFIDRPNRFIANVEIDGEAQVCHVKNTGRCRELLLPGSTVILEESKNPARKTKFDLVAVYKGERLINMDAQAPNKVFGEFAESGRFIPDLTLLRPETKFGSSRFDFYAEAGDKKIFIEVKGVTLEQDGVVLFPDAPTERGVKHIRELISAKATGFQAMMVFVVQMRGVKHFTPNYATHPEFGEALKEAEAAGVELFAFDCDVAENSLEIRDKVNIIL